MPAPSPGYSITVRAEAPAAIDTTGVVAAAVAEAGGALTALDVVESRGQSLVVDVTCNASDADHADRITAQIAAVPGVKVRKVSDRTFLLHLGGKLEVVPKVPLKHRDDLSRAYTPGVARVCLAIAENPDDARRLTIKRNTVAVVTAGPMLPSPSTADPSVTTATVLRLMVRRRTSSGFSAMARQTRATPGV